MKGIDEVTPGGTAADCHGHGTGVASLVGGAAPGAYTITLTVKDASGLTGTVVHTVVVQ